MNPGASGVHDALPGLRRVLAVFAHADDETLLAGALIAKLVSTGLEVRVLCLAPGGGERTQRMRNACSVLGVAAVETLRYAEGVMWPDEFLTYELKTHGARPSEIRRRKNGDDDQTLTPALATAPAGDLAGRIGGNSVHFRTPGSVGRIDLLGRSHFDKATGARIPTPHVTTPNLGSEPRDCLIYAVERAAVA